MRYLKTYEGFSTSELKDILSEINYDILDNPFEVEVKNIEGVLYKVFKEEIENLQDGYWFSKYSNQDKIENISEIVLISLRPKITDKIVYDDIREYIERSVEYMVNGGFNYLLEPVFLPADIYARWGDSPGIKYSLENIQEISEKKLMSFHIKFYK